VKHIPRLIGAIPYGTIHCGIVFLVIKMEMIAVTVEILVTVVVVVVLLLDAIFVGTILMVVMVGDARVTAALVMAT